MRGATQIAAASDIARGIARLAPHRGAEWAIEDDGGERIRYASADGPFAAAHAVERGIAHGEVVRVYPTSDPKLSWTLRRNAKRHLGFDVVGVP